MGQDSKGKFNYRIKFKFNQKIYIKIMRCKIVKTQKLMWYSIMKSTKNKKTSVLQYSIDGCWMSKYNECVSSYEERLYFLLV